MSVQYVKGSSTDYEAIVDLANYVFSHDYQKHDFPTLLPKLYEKGVNTSECHYLAKLDGKIIAMVGSFPMSANIMGKELRVAGIGTVAVHPYHRGHGYMTTLMNTAVDDMKKQGIAFGVLAGQRQRYENFGFEPCGTKLEMAITATNLRSLKDCRPDHITLIRMDKQDITNIKKAYDLYCKFPMYCIRKTEEFYDICRSWNNCPFIILKDNKFFGYLVCSSDYGIISEIHLCDTSEISNVLAAYNSHFHTENVKLILPPYDKEKIGIIQSYCDNVSINTTGNFNVFDYESVIRQLLMLKATYATLCSGQLILEIEEYFKLRIQVEGQRISVSRTDEPADCILPHLEAMSFLFSPLGAYYRYGSHLDPSVISWFPLPIYWPPADSV